MRKLYIMLENAITGMGGGQMYVRNKLLYMRSKGYDVTVYSCQQGEIIIEELNDYKDGIRATFLSSPFVYHNRTINGVLDTIENECKGYGEKLIESGIGHMALWGELLAERLNCKHMVHLLDERDDRVPEEYLPFYWFKHARRELSGINDKSLKMLFRNNPAIDDSNSYWLPSYCQNVVSKEKKESITEFPKADFTLCTVGRLEKDYVLEAAKAYVKVAVTHPSTVFNCVFIGGSKDNREKQIKNIFDGISNINLIMLGHVYPIPQSLLEKMDLFVSSSGSAGVSYSIDKPTISVDCNDLKAIGVLGYTTQKALNRDNEPMEEIDSLIEKVLFHEYLDSFVYIEKAKIDGLTMMNKHSEFLDLSSKTKEYYNLHSLKPARKDKAKRIISNVLGDYIYTKLYKCYICHK